MDRTTFAADGRVRPAVVDIEREATALLGEPEWAERDRHSRTVVSTDRLRIVLTALRPGAELGSPETDDTLTVQAVRGTLRLTVAGDAFELGAGQLATFAEPTDWSFRATTEALVLLVSALRQPAEPTPRR